MIEKWRSTCNLFLKANNPQLHPSSVSVAQYIAWARVKELISGGQRWCDDLGTGRSRQDKLDITKYREPIGSTRRSRYRYLLGCDFYDTLLTRNRTIRPASHRNLLNNKLKLHDTSLYHNVKLLHFLTEF